MTKIFINPKKLYQSGRAYSRGIKVNIGNSEMLFIAGQIAKNEKGEVVGKGDIAKQTEYVFEKIVSILSEAGMDLNDLVKINIYVVDMSEFEKVSTVRDRYLKESKPASTAIEISRTTNLDCIVEIDATAIKKIN